MCVVVKPQETGEWEKAILALLAKSNGEDMNKVTDGSLEAMSDDNVVGIISTVY